MSEDVIKKLQSTAVMHQVLRYMCSQSGEHGLINGWGIIEPWKILDSPNELCCLIQECAKESENMNWNGRNL